MKNTLIPLFALAALWAGGCREIETDSPDSPDSPAFPPAREAASLVNVRVGISGGDTSSVTKSVATPGVENFTEAYLFAFWADGADAGQPCTVNGAPATVYTTTKTFDWTLPAGTSIEVLAIVNAVEDIRQDLDRWAYGLETYSKDDILALKFTCASASDLIDLEYREYNMPMTGRVTVTLDPGNPTLSIPVKRLFAKFDITLDVSGWADEGWTVTAASVTGARSNTEVPYFYTGTENGFRQTDPTKFASVDSSTSADLANLNFRDAGGRSRAVTYYFLENCQRVPESAERWSSVALDLGARVQNCSYLKINVSATKPGYGQRRFGYRVYLDCAEGSAMKTGFNIIRNTYRSIILKLGAPQDGFEWTNTDNLNISPGSPIFITFETSLDEADLSFTSPDPRLVFQDYSFEEGFNYDEYTSFPNSGRALFMVSGGTPDGNYTVKGGNLAGDISDEATVQVVSPITINPTIPYSHYAFQRFTVKFSSASMAGMGTEQKERIEDAFTNLGLRGLSEDTHIISEYPAYHTSVNGTQDVVNKDFTLLVTKAEIATFQLYNKANGVSYKKITIPITAPSIKFVSSSGGAVSGITYDAPITGEDVKGYFQICDLYDSTLSILPEDLALGTLEPTPTDGFSITVGAAPGMADTYTFTAYLENWSGLEGWRSNADGTCTFKEKTFSTSIGLKSESGHPVCDRSYFLKVSNPFNEWFPDGDFRPFTYSVALDGTTDYAVTEDFYLDWPYTSGLQPRVLDNGNVNTPKGTFAPFSLLWEHSANEVYALRIANDLHNHGRIDIGEILTHSRTGDTMTMLWGKIQIIRDYIIYAGYQFSQVNYLSSGATPYNNGNLSRFIPYIFVRDNTGMPVTLEDCVRTTAVPATGINAVNPSENFYRETCAAEHWWHGGNNNVQGATDHSGGTLWDCEYALQTRESLLQNSVVVYPSPKTVTTSGGELSYYELKYAGPRIESTLAWVLGHNAYHADFVYSFRNVAYWNEPLFEFTTENISPGENPEIRTFPGGETYLAIGDYTRIRFFWKIKPASITRVNSYDTRYAINYTQLFQTTYSDTSDPSYNMRYFGGTMSQSATTATAYFDPRLNIRQKLKFFTPSIPFYRLKGNTVHAAFDGSVTGSYKEEDIVNSHKMNEAYGNADSFTLPGNLIH